MFGTKLTWQNHTQFKSGYAFQTIQSSCSHQRIINNTDILNQTSGLKRNITKKNLKPMWLVSVLCLGQIYKSQISGSLILLLPSEYMDCCFLLVLGPFLLCHLICAQVRWSVHHWALNTCQIWCSQGVLKIWPEIFWKSFQYKNSRVFVNSCPSYISTDRSRSHFDNWVVFLFHVSSCSHHFSLCVWEELHTGTQGRV